MSEVLSAFYWREQMKPIGDKIGTYRSPEQREVIKRRIRQLRTAGWSDVKIGEHLGVSKSYIADIAGRRFKHKPEEE